MTTSNQKKTALYCRLSQDDNTENEYGYHSNCSAAGNLDTFYPDLLVVVWLIYGRKPPFLTVSPIMIFIL